MTDSLYNTDRWCITNYDTIFNCFSVCPEIDHYTDRWCTTSYDTVCIVFQYVQKLNTVQIAGVQLAMIQYVLFLSMSRNGSLCRSLVYN